jgi:hypothetical protein
VEYSCDNLLDVNKNEPRAAMEEGMAALVRYKCHYPSFVYLSLSIICVLAHNNLSMLHTYYITEICIISAGEWLRLDSHLYIHWCANLTNCVPTNDGQGVIF